MPSRSSKYQSYFHEISYDPQIMVIFSNEDGIPAQNVETSEEYCRLREELWALVLILAQKSLTKRQLQYLKVFLGGHSQVEMAKILNVYQQSCIAKTFNFHCNPKIYGGIVPKLRKLALKDPEICALLKKIQEESDSSGHRLDL